MKTKHAVAPAKSNEEREAKLDRELNPRVEFQANGDTSPDLRTSLEDDVGLASGQIQVSFVEPAVSRLSETRKNGIGDFNSTANSLTNSIIETKST